MQQIFRRTLAGYYAAEGLNAFAVTIVGSCIFFWTRSRYGYSDLHNLLLGALQGLLFALVPRWGGRLGDRWGYDRALRLGAAGMLVAELILLTVHNPVAPAIAIALFTAFMSLTWPVLEAAVVLYPGRLSTPDRIGIYNLVWALPGAFAFLASGALFRWKPDAILVAAIAAQALMLAHLLRRPRASTPAESARAPHRGDAVPHADKLRSVRLARLANGTGYLMQCGLMATAPAVGDRLGLPAASTIWLVCVFLAARGGAFFGLWKWTGWHYRTRWLALALLAGPVSLAGIFFVPWTAGVFTALAVFGAAVGLCYYASLYYSLDLGEEKGEHSGQHESIIGLGVLLGPLTGVAGAAIFGHTAGAQGAIVAAAATVAATGLIRIRR